MPAVREQVPTKRFGYFVVRSPADFHLVKYFTKRSARDGESASDRQFKVPAGVPLVWILVCVEVGRNTPPL
jgi:hypothetical protein